MNNINKINYKTIKENFITHNISFESILSDEDYFEDFNSILKSNKNDITFFLDSSSISMLKNINAKVCLISKKNLKYLPKNIIPIIVNDTYKAFSIVSNLFKINKKSTGEISVKSNINIDSVLHNNVQIDPFVNIRENCKIYDNVIIESNCTIGPNVTIKENTVIKSNSTILHSKIGSDCIIKSGAVIGGTGFGFDPI